MNTGLLGFVFSYFSHHLTSGFDYLISAIGLALLRRMADSVVDEGLHNRGPSRWTQFWRQNADSILAQPQELQTVEVSPGGGWLARMRQRRATFRSQFIIALTVVLVGCFYLPRRLTPPAAMPGFRPVPVPVPAPASAVVLQLPDSQFHSPQPAATPGTALASRLAPTSSVQPQSPPTAQLALTAQGVSPATGTAVPVVAGSSRTYPLPYSTAWGRSSATDRIDPIYQRGSDTVGRQGGEVLNRPEPYVDALNPTIGNEFVSRPPMFAAGDGQPAALSTPVPSGAFPRFASRPPMGGLEVLREEIDKARASQSFRVDAGGETGLPARPVGEPGSLWPTFEAPHSASGEHFWLEPPFPGGFNQLYSPGYQFGSTGGGRYRIHHGIDIGNPVGTPVLASASGVVIHAGPDNPTLLGPYNDFYGNSVVIRLDRKLISPRGEQEVYVLYGHMVSVEVQEGQWVGAGDFLGGVGMTGIAIGPHLHLEVRVGQNSYLHTVNPALWMRPAAYAGTIAVRLLSENGRTWPGAQLSLFRYEEGGARWYRVIETYPELESIGPDPAWGENGALGHVPAGSYHITANINGEKVGLDITVQAGETTFVELRTNQ
ncbi:MAG: peptidoglycan DD-metalloendopeptidase family protein [Caldilineaceae bacterium]|nr:peptidoglycan DD-metalloendopeptidase family protein [Caldilineaceae bacterium]